MNQTLISLPQIVGHRIPIKTSNGNNIEYTNLDNAATTPAFKGVVDKITDSVNMYGSIHRGAGLKSIISTDLFEKSIQEILSFADSNSEQHSIILGLNATDCINKFANRINFKSDESIVVSHEEHSSNLLPWIKVTNVIKCSSSNDSCLDLNHLEEILKNNKVKIIAVTGASNLTGKVTNMSPIIELATKFNAEILMDASQLAGHRKIKRTFPTGKIDYIVFSGHKMYAPFGIGVLIGNKNVFLDGWPQTVGGGTIKWFDENTIRWSDLPFRENGGTPNYFGVLAMAEACKILKKTGFENIVMHEISLVNKAIEVFNQVKNIEFINKYKKDDAFQLPIFSFNVSGHHPRLISEYLSKNKGIGVRYGFHCQYKKVSRFLEQCKVTPINKSIPNFQSNEEEYINHGLIRASCGLGNTKRDIINLKNAIVEYLN